MGPKIYRCQSSYTYSQLILHFHLAVELAHNTRYKGKRECADWNTNTRPEGSSDLYEGRCTRRRCFIRRPLSEIITCLLKTLIHINLFKLIPIDSDSPASNGPLLSCFSLLRRFPNNLFLALSDSALHRIILHCLKLIIVAGRPFALREIWPYYGTPCCVHK